jgi:hypothetical protein
MLAVLLLTIAAAVGGGIGGGLANKHKCKPPVCFAKCPLISLSIPSYISIPYYVRISFVLNHVIRTAVFH